MMSCMQNSSSPAQYWPFLVLIYYASTGPWYSMRHLLFPVCHLLYQLEIVRAVAENNLHARVCVCCSEGWGPRFAITRSKDEHLLLQGAGFWFAKIMMNAEISLLSTGHQVIPTTKKPRHTKAQGFHTSCNLLGVLSLLSTRKLTSASQVLLPWWCLRWTNG